MVFFALVLVRPRVAFIALALAIVMLYRGRSTSARQSARPYVSDDSSI